MNISPSRGSRIFDCLNITLLSIFALLTVLPFVYVIAGSFATQKELLLRGFIVFPTEFSLDAYKYIFSTPPLSKVCWSPFSLRYSVRLLTYF